MLEVRNLHFSYNGRPVFDDVSVDFPQGTFTCIVGPNGAGKTTLLRLFANALDPDSGEVLIDGAKPPYPKGWLSRNLSYLPHRPDILFPFTAYETVSLGLSRKLLSFSENIDDDMVRHSMEEVDCLEFAGKSLSELSAGEQQRVFIAQALVSNPKVMLLDEPTASLDISHQLDFMRKLRKWSDDGRTIVAVVHDLNLAAAFAHRMCFVKEGKISANGDVKDVFTSELIEDTFGVQGVVENSNIHYWWPIVS